ncbi:MAG TPA: serine hydrolase [Myxococcota bacterium]|jgi:CubicO group peptidase (beta-lactamase class C family)
MRVRRILIAALLAAVLAAGWLGLRELRVGTGYAAKVLCSGVFVAGRSPESLLAEDLDWFWWVRPRVDLAQRTATSDLLGLSRSTAVYREGLGCALAVGASTRELRAQGFDPGPAPGRAGIPWPEGDRVPDPALPGDRRAALDAAVAAAFDEPDPAIHRRTRAVVVLRSGQLVAERYAEGFGAATPLLGWSMTKSVIATLIGIQVRRGSLDPASPAPVPAWAGDERAAITLDQLLRMSSGLAFKERNGAFGDSAAMLFRSRSAADYAARSALAHPPGSFWSYSSGTSNLLAAILRASLPGDGALYHRFPREALFDRIGMRSAVLETDAAGDFVGSSFCYATARDWARFGLLHAQDGVWRGERLLPEGWVAAIRRPTPPAPQGSYGAHWWLNAGAPGAPEDRPYPSLPADLFYASGYEGQFVVVLPSQDLVVVRLGQSEPEQAFDLEGFLGAVVAAFRGD